AFATGFRITPERLQTFDEGRNIGELIDDLIFDSDVFTCNSKKRKVSYALQNNTAFYTSLLACVKRGPVKTSYPYDYDIIYSNELYAEIGDKISKLMKSHDRGREIETMASDVEHDKHSFMTKLLIAELFEFGEFGSELKKLLGAYPMFRKCFGDFVGKVKEYIGKMNIGFAFYGTNNSRSEVLSIPGADFNNSHLKLGLNSLAYGGAGVAVGAAAAVPDVNYIDPANLAWINRGVYADIFVRFKENFSQQVRVFTVNRAAGTNGSNALRRVLTLILLVVKNLSIIPFLVRNYYLLQSIKRRQDFVNKIRGEYYKSLFTVMLKKVKDIDIDDYRYSELEYYISEAKNIRDPIERKIFLKILFCRPSKGFFNALIQSHIPFPFGFIIFRPYIKAHTASGIMGDFSGGEVGFFALGNSNTMFQNDAIIKSYYLHHHNYMNCSIVQPQNLYAMDDLWMEGFFHGYNTIFFEKEHLKIMFNKQFRLPRRDVKENRTQPSLIVAITKYRDDRLDDFIDIRGRFPAEEGNEDTNDYHFVTTKGFFDVTGLDKATGGVGARTFGRPRVNDTNFACGRTHQWNFDPRTRTWKASEGQCYIGARHYANMVKEVLGYPKNRNQRVLRRPDYASIGVTGVSAVRV
ncbi:MAG: hypothetical protein EBU66_19585, partial [Bacteroidetes bacterium]|nr:hypothetical protein [Bacteroidota bacterium]